MSGWQGYIDNMMTSKAVVNVGIFGLDGTPWAVSPSLNIDAKTVQTLVAGISNPTNLQTNGVTIVDAKGNAVKYIFVRNDVGVCILFKQQGDGLLAYKSNQAVIIGFHDSSVKAEIAATAIGKVIDHLTKHGY